VALSTYALLRETDVVMRWFLNLIYAGLLTLLSPFILWRMVRHGRYRRGAAERVLGRLPRAARQRPCVWFHAVSVGEVVQLTKVVEQFREATGDVYEIVVSASTDTGYDLATRRMANCQVVWFPLDFTWAVSAALDRIAPDIVVLMELELWPNFIDACMRRGVPVTVINARMSPNSFRGYRRAGRLLRPLFQSLTCVVVQSQQYAERLAALGVSTDRMLVSGSVKFDGVETARDNTGTNTLRKLFGLQSQDIVIVAGSTQSPEEQLVIDAWIRIRQRHPHVRLILVPRHRERFAAVAELIRSKGCGVVRRSALRDSGNSEEPGRGNGTIGLLDTIGELSHGWGLADIAFVGGSFGSRGGQNMIEPAAYGAAIVFGPNTWNFRDVVSCFHQEQACVQLSSPAELLPEFERLVSDGTCRRRIGDAARTVVLNNQGATQLTVQMIQDCVARSSMDSDHSSRNRAA
jgi:3-deoxy-D-manno-octulosonic-acid transferase